MNKANLIQFIQDTLPISIGKAEQLAEKFNERKILKNDLILKEGAICNESHFIDDGLLRAYTHDLDGNDVTTAFYSKKMFASDISSFFRRIPSGENIQALTDCNTCYITYRDMQESFHTIPEFREFGRLNLIKSYGALKHRMLSMLHETAEQRYANLISSNPEIIQIAPLKNIASFLGITDSSLSRIRKEFIKK
jgi:CRP-like cAMP-binding protein